MKPTTLFLDAGGVLVDPDWSRIAAVLRGEGIAADGAALQAAEPRAKRRMDAAHLERDSDDATRQASYYELVLSAAGVTVPAELAARAWKSLVAEHARRNFWQRIPAGVVPGLSRLREAGLRLAVVSNSNGTVRETLAGLGLAGYFETIVDSEEEGVEKPDPRIFRLALERVGTRPEDTLHVGDLYHVDVLGARAAGIEAWLMDPADLYPEADCPRVRSLADLALRLATGQTGSRD